MGAGPGQKVQPFVPVILISENTPPRKNLDLSLIQPKLYFERSDDMAWILDDSRPIYLQIEDLIKANIIAGVYQPGQKLPSVRDLAAEAAVNPNTMQKALTELERSGLVYTQRTSGRFITEDVSKMTELKEQIAREQIQLFLKNMEQLGLTRDDIRRLLEKEWKEES